MDILSGEGIHLSWSLLRTLWAWSIIPLVILWWLGMAMRIQASGAEGGSQYWGPVVTFLCITWVLFWIVKGIFF